VFKNLISTKTHILCCLFVCAVGSRAIAQNLVPNPGFEDYTKCPGNYSQHSSEFRVNHWSSASLGTPDYFNKCSTGDADVPHNWAGVSNAQEGQGYAGIYVWMTTGRDYREYLQCQLTDSLVKDTLYIIQLHYRLSSYSKYAVDRIGLHLSTEPVKARQDKVLPIEPTFSIIQDSALTMETGHWEVGRMEYRAKGGEQFLLIGNFFDDASTRFYRIKFMPTQQEMLAMGSYYYIDQVSVTPRFSNQKVIEDFIPEFIASKTELNTTYVLKNIQFEFNSYKLHPSSSPELDKLVMWLRQNPSVNVQLAGHTDDVGSVRYNLTLSQNRAKTVAAYLTSQGIPRDRITSAGYGKDKPLITETTEEARGINRRVEVKFVK